MPSAENEVAEEGEIVRGRSAPSDEVSFKSEAARTDGFPIRFYIFQTTQPADEEDEEEMSPLRRCCHLL